MKNSTTCEEKTSGGKCIRYKQVVDFSACEGDATFFCQKRCDMEEDLGQSYSAVSFGGGGLKFTFTSSDIKGYQSTEGSSKSLEAGAGLETDFHFKTFAPKLGFELGLMISGVSASKDETTTANEKTVEQSFTLSDPDLGDFFDVEVYN
jgi:hypothetical protein